MSADKERCLKVFMTNLDPRSEISRRWAERQKKKRQSNHSRFDWTAIVVLILAVVSSFHLISVFAVQGRNSAAAEQHLPTTSPESGRLPKSPSQTLPAQSGR